MGNKKFEINKMSFINLNPIKNKSWNKNCAKNNDNIKDKVDNKKFKKEKKLKIKNLKVFE